MATTESKKKHTHTTKRKEIKSHWKREDFKCLRQLYDVRFLLQIHRFFLSNADKF